MCSYSSEKWNCLVRRGIPGKLIKHSSVLLLLAGISLGAAVTARSQRHDILGCRDVLVRLKRTYKLTSADVATITPLVRQGNVEMLSIYLRFSGNPPE